MSDDLNKKIKQLTDILGQDNLPDNVKDLLSLLTGSSSKQDSPKRTDELPAPRYEKESWDDRAQRDERTSKDDRVSREDRSFKEERSGRSELEENIEMVRKIKNVMQKLNSNNDPRISLLNAIRPFLSKKRQSKLNNCIKLLHMTSLTKYMDEYD